MRLHRAVEKNKTRQVGNLPTIHHYGNYLTGRTFLLTKCKIDLIFDTSKDALFVIYALSFSFAASLFQSLRKKGEKEVFKSFCRVSV